MEFYAVEAIRSRLSGNAPERRFGFVLNSSSRQLYRDLSDELSSSVKKSSSVRGISMVTHIDGIDPERAAAALLELGEHCAAIAAVCVDHPLVSAAVNELARRGIPVVAMVSDISTPARAGFVGSNDWQLGRTAGWFATRLAPEGKAAVLMGSERYTCQQVHESAFRGYLRAHSMNDVLTSTGSTKEDDEVARTITRELIMSTPDLKVLFVAGGGLDGVCEALAERGRNDVTLIGCEMTERTRSRMATGEIDVILAHPVKEIARQAVQALIRVAEGPITDQPFQVTVPFSVVVSENG